MEITKIEKILNIVQITEIISSYINLSKKGKNFFGICPFHDDSHPSLSVSPEKKIFKCFSCEEGGNVIAFVSKIEKISYENAAIKLGTQIGIQFNLFLNQPKYNEKEKQIINILKIAINFFQLTLDLKEGKEAKKYIINIRKITPEIQEQFHIGYSPSNFQLISFLKEKKKFNESTLMNSSLINFSGKVFFKNRLTFGIKNEFGDFVAIAGRTLNNLNSPKYIVSAESSLFYKSKIIYNWFEAKDYILKAKKVYLVEGFFDVIAFYKINIKNVVALMGVNLSKNHIQKFKKLEVILMLDSDKAGINATIKILKILIENKIKTSIIVNDFFKDADEILEKKGKKEFQKIINNSINGFDYMYDFLKKKCIKNNIIDGELFINYFQKFLILASPIKQNILMNKIEKDFKISKIILLNEMQKQNQFISNNNFIPKQQFLENNKQYINYKKTSHILIRSLIKNPELINYYKKIMNTINFGDSKLLVIVNLIIKFQENKENILNSKYLELIDNTISLNHDEKIISTNKELEELVSIINLSTKRHQNKKIKLKKNFIKNGEN